MSSSNCCFLTCIQVSQEAGQVAWYSHLFQNFPQFTVIHTVKGFGIVNKAEIDVFLELVAFSIIQHMLAIWSLVPLPFLKPAWTSGSSRFMYCWSLAWRILSITLLVCLRMYNIKRIKQWSPLSRYSSGFTSEIRCACYHTISKYKLIIFLEENYILKMVTFHLHLHLKQWLMILLGL